MNTERKRWILWMLAFLAAIVIGRGIIRYLDFQWSAENRGRSDTSIPCLYLASMPLDPAGGGGTPA